MVQPNEEKQNSDLVTKKWGTPQPILIGAPRFGMVFVQGFGDYSYTSTLLGEDIKDAEERARTILLSALQETLTKISKTRPVIEVMGSTRMVSKETLEVARQDCSAIGVVLEDFRIGHLGLSSRLDEDTKAVIEKIEKIPDPNESIILEQISILHEEIRFVAQRLSSLENISFVVKVLAVIFWASSFVYTKHDLSTNAYQYLIAFVYTIIFCIVDIGIKIKHHQYSAKKEIFTSLFQAEKITKAMGNGNLIDSDFLESIRRLESKSYFMYSWASILLWDLVLPYVGLIVATLAIWLII